MKDLGESSLHEINVSEYSPFQMAVAKKHRQYFYISFILLNQNSFNQSS